jgi:hypothetical protein
MNWKHSIVAIVLLVVSGCGKNDGFRTSAPIYSPSPSYPSNPFGPSGGSSPYYPGGSGPGNPGGGYYGGGYPGGYFQPSYPSSFGQGFYPWAPIYGYYQQSVALQPVFVVLWNGWQNYCNQNQVSLNDFTTFWYVYSPQVISPQLYNYFGNTFYPWMTPTTSFSPAYNPQVFWQNYSGVPYSYSCSALCY